MSGRSHAALQALNHLAHCAHNISRVFNKLISDNVFTDAADNPVVVLVPSASMFYQERKTLSSFRGHLTECFEHCYVPLAIPQGPPNLEVSGRDGPRYDEC